MNLCLRIAWLIIPKSNSTFGDKYEENSVGNHQRRQCKNSAASRQKVIIDSDLAELYGVEVKHLNQQVKRNHRRFPQDFAFRLRPREPENLRSQIVTSSERRGGGASGDESTENRI